MMKMTKIRLALVLVGLLASSAALAQAKYVWIDEHGVKQFSDTPPPGSIPEKNIIKQPRRTGAPSTSDTPAAGSGTDDTKPAPSLSDREADYNKRHAEQAAKDKKAAEQASKDESKSSNCASAKKYLDSLNSGVRMRTTDKDGQPVVMDDDQHAKETERAQQAVTDNCG